MKTPIRILLAEDHAMVREGLRAILDSHDDLCIVNEAKSGREAVTLAEADCPEVIIMDINMPDLNGIDATRQIHAACPRTKIIGLSVHRQSHYIAEILKAGAVGYVPKQSAVRELITAIRTVIADKMYISPEVTGELVDAHIRMLPGFESNAYTQLSGREREVLQLLAEGKSVKDIAGILFLSVPTVHTHRQHIMKKLDLHSVAELTKYAIREGLTTLEE